MQTMLTFLLAGLATYHETYNRSMPFAAASLATAPKYILFPEQRAKKVEYILIKFSFNKIILFSVLLFFVIVIIHFVSLFGILSIMIISKWVHVISHRM
jgi:hypothetical protein